MFPKAQQGRGVRGTPQDVKWPQREPKTTSIIPGLLSWEGIWNGKRPWFPSWSWDAVGRTDLGARMKEFVSRGAHESNLKHWYERSLKLEGKGRSLEMGNRNSRKKEIFGEKKNQHHLILQLLVFSIIVVIPYVWLARRTDRQRDKWLRDTTGFIISPGGISWITSEQKREGKGNWKFSFWVYSPTS